MSNPLLHILGWFHRLSGQAVSTARASSVESEAESKLRVAAEEKYRQLYLYATELLKEELDRFNRADEKAAKVATTFVFLIGAAAYFDKLISDKLIPPRSGLEWSLVILGAMTLIVSFVGWFLANWVGRMRGYSRLPLNKDVFEFFDQQPLLNFYGSFSKNAEEAFQLNQKRTDQKHAVLVKAFYAMVIATALLVALVSLYGLYSWQNPGKFDSLKEHTAPKMEQKKEDSSESEKSRLAETVEPTAIDLSKPNWEIKAPGLFVSLNSQPSDTASPGEVIEPEQ